MTTEWQSLNLALATRKSYGCMLNKNLCEQRAGQAGMAETDAGSLLTGGRLRQTGTIRRLPDSEGAQAPEPARRIVA